MQVEAVMQRLESQGTEQARKIYQRHCTGVGAFGTSFAEMRKLAKEIKKDHAMALELWGTGIFEARVVATMIADPKLLSPEEAEAWVGEMTGHPLTDELVNNLLVKTPYADEKALDWIDSPREFVGRAGWHLVGGAAKAGRDRLDYAGLLAKIEQEIDGAPNRKREAMNNALMAIGIYRRDLSEAAIGAATRIGPVDIDHGETSCKTPFAPDYIRKALSR